MIKKRFTRAVGFKLVYSLLVLFAAVIWAVPLFMIVFNAFKSKQEIAVNPNGFPAQFVWSNISEAFTRGEYAESFKNSGLITLAATIMVLFICAGAAYVISRNAKTKWSKTMYMIFLSGMMVPGGLMMTANYRLLMSLNILNTPFAGIFLNVAASVPLVIFLYTGFIRTVPRELDESAVIDGCSVFKTFWRIIFPLLKPVTSTAIILTAPVYFNDFINPLLYMNRVKTVTYSLYTFRSRYLMEWEMIFAGVLISSVPLIIVFLIFQSKFEKGLVAGAVKG